MPGAEDVRLIHMAKKREREKEAMQNQLKQITDETEKSKLEIASKFRSNTETAEEMKSRLYGLVSLDDMKSIQKDEISNRDLQVARGESGSSRKPGLGKLDGKDSHIEKHTQKRVLSFGFDDGEEEEDEEPVFIPKKRVGMNPDVDTTFLPDKEREEENRRKKEELAAEWREKQEIEKNEEIVVGYAYWDGSSHQRSMKIKKGCTIGHCLSRAIEALRKEFTELKACTNENLMFVKEDLIIPHFYTFQDFIATKAMGKSGPLYIFDAATDVRIRQDVSSDCGEAHPAKVVLRSWYEKNKHIYPASLWEPFVPSKKYGRNLDDLSDL